MFVPTESLASCGSSDASLFRRKFAVEDVSRVLYSLCYFDDVEPDPLPSLCKAVSWEKVNADLRAWVKVAADELA